MTVVSRDEWRAARAELLAQEKELTKARDAVNAARRALPKVEINKEYAFGPSRLIDLFEGRRQLIVYHFMWRFEPDEGCPSCSFLVDSVGELAHLHACDTTLALVSRAPLASIERFQKRMGWTIPWYSSAGTDFNTDFGATVNEDDVPGASVFVHEDGRVYHTYSTFWRGADVLLNTYNYLDLTPLGRQRYVNEFPHHDRY
jgi:predicted dithiol-disulfide oxidoreductase (DUF899 family)